MNTTYALRGDKRRKKLDAIQDQIRTLFDERERVLNAPITPDEFRARLKAQFSNNYLPASYLARTAVPDPTSKSGPVEGIMQLNLGEALRSRANSQLQAKPRTALEVNLPLSLSDLGWLFGNEVIIDRVVDAATASSGSTLEPIDYATRTAREQELSAQLEALQMDEEREVLALFDAGVRALRREDADPALIIRVWQMDSTGEVA